MTYQEENIQLNTGIETIYGTVTLPEIYTKVPVVLIIAGSGPTNRDGNNTQGLLTDSYKMIAYELAQNGIASVRYDKRGIGESSKAMNCEKDLVFNDFIDDAVNWVQMLHNDKRFSKIAILGHSEGSLIGMVAVNKVQVDAFISVAGMGYSFYDTLKRQLAAQTKDVYDECIPIMNELKKGNRVTDINKDYYSLFRPSVQPYLISLFKYDPAIEIKKLTIPLLIIQGSTDLQVNVADATVLNDSNHNAVLKIINGMNHILKDAPIEQEKNLKTYGNPKLPLSSMFKESLINFMKDTFKL
ncbi:lysophospholipase [Clostridium estertheticum]|uniref:alpha/beta hydrolase family protein n=1 Tax=Clostridium estertheticum TaxID=238834 RepID=UPI001C6EB4B0|nr:alpha/beta fold hydrolase [Clostridium estertheticum]MBW9172772.1 lysophospholipase [Clostridium estertheticum]WLC77697.1 lysophospholipase [Clostridium estertheticum]